MGARRTRLSQSNNGRRGNEYDLRIQATEALRVWVHIRDHFGSLYLLGASKNPPFGAPPYGYCPHIPRGAKSWRKSITAKGDYYILLLYKMYHFVSLAM